MKTNSKFAFALATGAAYIAAPAFAASLPTLTTTACADNPKYHELDFTLGKWQVTTLEGARRSVVTMASVLDGCAIYEVWARPAGEKGNGKAFLTFSEYLGKWTYYWVSDKGAAIIYTGELVAPGNMRFVTEFPTEKGMRRRHWSLITKPNGGVRELSRITDDDGESWRTEYDLQWAKLGR